MGTRTTSSLRAACRAATTILLAGLMCSLGCGDDGPDEAEQQAAALAKVERQKIVNRKQQELADLQKLLQQTQRRIEAKQDELAEAERREQMAALQQQVQELSLQIEQLQQKVLAATQAHAEMEAMTPEAVRQQPDVKAALDRDISLKTLQAMLADQRQALAEAQQRGAGNEQLQQLKEQIARTQDAYAGKRDALVTGVWQARKADRAEAIAQLEATTNELREQRKQAQQALAEHRQPFVTALAELDARRLALADRIASLQSRIQDIQAGGSLTPADRLGATTMPAVSPTAEPAEDQ